MHERQDLSATELLRLARGSIEHGLVHGKPLPVDCSELPAPLTELAATFTTLRSNGELRGCCGILEAVRPLAEDVSHSAFTAAFRDPRFGPLGKHELDTILLDVSVLSPLEPFPVVANGRRATFLPKVWDTLPEPSQFLAALKAKCGLERDYWSERMQFLRYRTTSYTESR